MCFNAITDIIDSRILTFFFSLSWRKRLFILELLFLQKNCDVLFSTHTTVDL